MASNRCDSCASASKICNFQRKELVEDLRSDKPVLVVSSEIEDICKYCKHPIAVHNNAARETTEPKGTERHIQSNSAVFLNDLQNLKISESKPQLTRTLEDIPGLSEFIAMCKDSPPKQQRFPTIPQDINTIDNLGKSFKFVNRENELKQISQLCFNISRNWLGEKGSDYLKRFTIPVVAGQSGLGKTTLVPHAIRNMDKFIDRTPQTEQFLTLWQECIDNELYIQVRTAHSKQAWYCYISGFQQETELKYIDLQAPQILATIDRILNKPALVFFHIDEAQDIAHENLKDFLRQWLELGGTCQNVCLVPIITGTNISHIQNGVSSSGCSYNTIFLQYLKKKHYMEILMNLFPSLWKSSEKISPELNLTLKALVGPPRLFLLFLFVCTEIGKRALGIPNEMDSKIFFLERRADMKALEWFFSNMQDKDNLPNAERLTMAQVGDQNSKLFQSLHEVKNSSVVEQLYVFSVLGQAVTLDQQIGSSTVNSLANQGLIALKPISQNSYLIDYPALYLMYLSKNSTSTFLPSIKLVATPKRSLSPDEAEIMDCNSLLLKILSFAFQGTTKVSLTQVLNVKNKEEAAKVEIPIPPPTDQSYELIEAPVQITSSNFLEVVSKLGNQTLYVIHNKDKAPFGDWILYWPTVKAPAFFMHQPDKKPTRSSSKDTPDVVNTKGFAIIGQSKRYEVSKLSSASVQSEIHKVQQIADYGVAFVLLIVTDVPAKDIGVPEHVASRVLFVSQEGFRQFFGPTAAARRLHIVRRKLFHESVLDNASQ